MDREACYLDGFLVVAIRNFLNLFFDPERIASVSDSNPDQ